MADRYITPVLWFLATHPSIGVVGGLFGIVLIAVGVAASRVRGGAR